MAESTYEQIKAKLLADGKLFEDVDFPANNRSLGIENLTTEIVWKRPTELVRSPQFIVEGTTRFDVNQGELGDCWFIAAAACVASSSKKLLDRCVPSDQSFQNGYAGIFRFKFWHFSRWTEVIIDDRLPISDNKLMFARNNGEPNEFWVPLMEKAYAKLYGNYSNIDGGHITSALIDFTGGLSEYIQLKKKSQLPTNLFDLMYKTFSMNSLCGCSIDAKVIREESIGNGLYAGHAYSITNMVQGKVNGRVIRLLRLRNPWGKGEWQGAWSDYSDEWTIISPADKENLGYNKTTQDGEFWMSYEDWLTQFEHLRFCHLYPDALTAEVAEDTHKRSWNVTYQKGSWTKGVNAGGCGNYPYVDEYWTNPQIAVKLLEADDDDKDGRCSTVISLMQINADAHDDLFIGFSIYKLKYGKPELLNDENYSEDSVWRKSISGNYTNVREVTMRERLLPGVYIIIPSTFSPGKEGDYMLRVFTEKTAESEPVDDNKPAEEEKEKEEDVVEPPKEKTQEEKIRDVFNKYMISGRLDASGVRIALNDILGKDVSTFSVSTARSLMAIADRDQSGSVDVDEFGQIVKEMLTWKKVFKKFDKDDTDTISVAELQEIFNILGLSLSTRVQDAIKIRYGNATQSLDLAEYMQVCSKLITLYRHFKNFPSSPESDKAQISLDDWLAMTMYF